MFNLFHKENFSKFFPKPNNVLLIETNGCHGEVIGGYLKYFQDLNLNTYVLVTDTIKKENPFCRLNPEKVFHTKFKNFKNLLKSEYLDRYDHIFVMSSVNYTGGSHAVKDLFPDLQKHKSVYWVHHNSAYIQNYYPTLDKKHSIMLGRIVTPAGHGITYLNPHLFGDYSVPQKSDETIFVSVGGINPKRKNHTLLLGAIKNLHNKNYKFKVLVVGGGSLKHMDKTVKQHIQLLGHLDYDKMYEYVESANFFLPLLDADNPDHNRYIETQGTGSTQLIYGFRKIPVIHKKFAKFYEFDTKNAILYDDLTDGMERAILMSNPQYAKHIAQLDHTATNIKNETMNNLKDILDA
ncbi:MAG: glycosyltransferase [Alphaproteobacteria bacterium]|nr:glycosyltransferase [Alphaproteobacteria bacterium]